MSIRRGPNLTLDYDDGESVQFGETRTVAGASEWRLLGEDSWHPCRGYSMALTRASRRLGKRVGWALWCALTGGWQAGVESAHSTTRTNGANMQDEATDRDHFTKARDAGVDHGHAVQLARFFCPHDEPGAKSPCDDCVTRAIPALVWLGGDKPAALVKARKMLAGNIPDSGEASAYAVVSIAESLHEANIDARVRDMTVAHVTIFDEWAEAELRDVVREILNGELPMDGATDVHIADRVVDRFRHSMSEALARVQS